VGGKSHQFVVRLSGVGAGPQGVADDGVFIDARQARRLADTTAILEVPEDSQGLVFRESGGEQGAAFAFGEACLTGTADEHAALLVATVAEADAEVVAATQAKISTVRVLATEETQVVHENHSLAPGQTMDSVWEVLYNYTRRLAALWGHHQKLEPPR
jgi:hypothetical protein